MSTAMLSQPTVVSIPPSLAGPASPTKKRRRRAPATGAAEDCFTCRANGIKCDRRRPYCGPCLEVGNDCRGYRTQLTWGVGVASRGKLRGLHLPIVNLAVDNKNTQKVTKKKAEDKTTSTNGNGVKSKKSKTPESNGRDYDSQRNSGVGKLSIITSYDFVNMEVPSSSSSRASSAISASTAGTSPALSAISQASMPSQRLSQARKSPNPSSYSPYSASSQQQYHPHMPSQQQQYQAPIQHYHKSPYSHVSLPPHQPAPSMLLSPMSEYEPSFSSSQHYPMSSAPATAPLYDMVTGVSSSSYHPTSSLTVTSSGVSYAPMTAPIIHTSRMMGDDHLHHNHSHHHHHQNGSWNGVGGMGNLHQQHVQAGTGNLSDLLYDDDMLDTPEPEFSYNTSSYQNEGVSISASQSLSASLSPISTQFPLQLANISPNLRFLINYYDKTVCASMVAFDGPGNPYRQQILPMAFNNEALMEAIYALSTSHLESKRKGAISLEKKSSKTSPASSPRSDSPMHGHSPSSPLSPSYHPSLDSYQKLPLPSAIASAAKEKSSAALNHKNNSIHLLNAQLANPELAKSDAAMATLLILLFYHISDTGIGQFKTHLSGVKKLMGMRCVGKETGIWGWMETVFTWLDNMSASVNNREAQLRGGYLDMIFASSDDWDLESLTGCDRDLFMRLAGLGRINMLSQMPPTHHSHRGCIEEDDGETEPFRDENDGRHEFWLAWNAIKKDLRDWRPTTTYAATPSRHKSTEIHPAPTSNPTRFEDNEFSSTVPVPSPTSSSYSMSPPPPPPLSAGSPHRRKTSKAHEAVENNHWLHASNVYRHAAILYVNRLAYPHLPSSHSIFQNTVRDVLDHVNCIPNSGLSHRLLWPLFITGTECVVDAHRDMIRERCVEMQRECGFFNRVSGLDVLEKIWSDDIIEEEGGRLGDQAFAGAKRMGGFSQSAGGRGLRWRRVTGREDSEYLMI